MDKLCVAADTAKAILEIVRDRYGGRHTARPYDIHRPDETTWWVIPSTDWPSYLHGKFFFRLIEGTRIETGIYIEKGFSPEIGHGVLSVFNSTRNGHGTSSSHMLHRVESTGCFVNTIRSIPSSRYTLAQLESRTLDRMKCGKSIDLAMMMGTWLGNSCTLTRKSHG